MQNLIGWLTDEQKTLEKRLDAYTDKQVDDAFAIENKAMIEGRLLQIKETMKWIQGT